jgi:hypothetical protein
METVGTTLLRIMQKTAIGYLETYGSHAEPEVSEFLNWVSRRLPPVSMQQELRAAVEMHRLMEPRTKRRFVSQQRQSPGTDAPGFAT